MPSLDTKFSMLKSNLVEINKTIFECYHKTKNCAEINDKVNESLLLLEKCINHSKRHKRSRIKAKRDRR